MRYYKYSDYLTHRFGCRTAKVSVDAGFACPNRDGKISTEGCIFCNNKGFSYNSRGGLKPLEMQIQDGIDSAKMRLKAKKFIIYFQAYTNTYAPLEDLRSKYDVIKGFEDIVGLSIGTRPDCIDEPILDLLEEYAANYEVWIEMGLQSIHDRTLAVINRGHRFSDFLKAYKLIKERGSLRVCTHIIAGLPGESQDDMIMTAKALAELKVNGIKIHPLHVMKGTKLERLFSEGKYRPMTMDEYVKIAANMLEYLWPKTIIQRLTADCPRDILITPGWINDKNTVLRKIESELVNKDSFQGRLFGILH